jgi:hypothetical protein
MQKIKNKYASNFTIKMKISNKLEEKNKTVFFKKLA